MKNQYAIRTGIVGLWLLLIWTVWQIFSASGPSIEINLGNLSKEQQSVYDEIVADYQSKIPERVGFLDTGEPVYEWKHGVFSGWIFRELPSWYEDGQILLNDAEIVQIVKTTMIPAPWWMFWTDDIISVGTYDDAVFFLSGGLIVGLAISVISLLLDKSKQRFEYYLLMVITVLITIPVVLFTTEDAEMKVLLYAAAMLATAATLRELVTLSGHYWTVSRDNLVQT